MLFGANIIGRSVCEVVLLLDSKVNAGLKTLRHLPSQSLEQTL